MQRPEMTICEISPVRRGARTLTSVVGAEEVAVHVQRHPLHHVRHVAVLAAPALQALQPLRQRPDLQRLVAQQDEAVLRAHARGPQRL